MPRSRQLAAKHSFVAGPLTCAKNLEDVSTVDFARADERNEEVASAKARRRSSRRRPSAPVELNSPVRNIDNAARDRARHHARRAARTRGIVTASTNVLAARRIDSGKAYPARQRRDRAAFARHL